MLDCQVPLRDFCNSLKFQRLFSTLNDLCVCNREAKLPTMYLLLQNRVRTSVKDKLESNIEWASWLTVLLVFNESSIIFNSS